MKKLTVLMVFSLVLSSLLSAQSVKSMSFNGATGLVATPTALIGWEKSDLAIDGGYHYIDTDNEGGGVAKVLFSLFKKAEIGLAYDLQREAEDDEDLILTGKLQFYSSGGTAACVGGNYQFINLSSDVSYEVFQLYLAGTYSGNFFGMPAVTTVTVGKHFGEYVNDDNIDFSMGFELVLFPKVFQNYVHWINDFSNYSYSVNAMGADAGHRGAFNTGLRIDAVKSKSVKFVIDGIVTDALDANRSFTLGAVFGAALK
jgi:hypothetical protein